MHYIKWLAIGAVFSIGGWVGYNQYLSVNNLNDATAPLTQRALENNKPLLSGSWIYNAGDCDSKLVLDSVFAINFKADADLTRAGTINTSSKDFTIYNDATKYQNLITLSEKAIANCDNIATPQETPLIATYTPYPLNKQFVYYKDAELLVQVDENDVFIFRRITRIREIKAMLNSGDNKAT